ncbi:hypothetical protein M717_04065 [Neisseria gonorrhoeae SK33414]|uniref:Uncharacterized protein n=1 Tax=Neisseria gonorrhoeae 3502 TaxID=1193404 RepID=A0AA44UAH1_NEIGO|nr:hypothetical protein T556_01905 [Neisseria gonorrhoeae NG-k51.05]KLR77273.1 hypothetical protein M717_04065 [Neisseria gonorrhoeae SK33414]KLR78768.1 hypothetical protein M679_03710 [Neisseria gonorrhoeae SK7842]KLR81534.1 hypothetical protein M680_06065 [Neisseria gonorrhoeae SK8976]KLR82247.1 hypothetical protein M684_04685 [Neisseria gonorrhoeae SK15454]KLR83452.1 hypothetical protein M675_03050 [Neisseria gonorrhoeae SK1902]KLR87161.1 hypothetical protein M677_02975 [Neisseria gonorrho
MKVSGAKKAAAAKSEVQRENVFPIKLLILLRIFIIMRCVFVFKGRQAYTP